MKMRFLDKLAHPSNTLKKEPKRNWWKPLSIAASIAVILVSTLFLIPDSDPDIELSERAPQVSETKLYYANLIKQEVNKLALEDSPETKQIIADAMMQLKTLETDYNKIESDLLQGGNTKILLNAMITNFQTRMDLLQSVMEQIDEIKNFNNTKDDSNII